MMWILIILTVVGISLQGFFQKQYNCIENERRISIYSFNLMIVIAAMLFFIPQVGGEFNINGELMLYSFCFAATYFCALFFAIRAIKEGSLSLTSLFTSYSLIIPTMYGALFMNEKIGVWKIVGFVLLLISLYFVANVKKGEKVSKKWLAYAALAFLGNGLCSTVQRIYQIKSSGENKAEFMIFALLMIALSMLILIMITEKRISMPKIKNGGIFAVACGLANGAVNLLTMVMAKYPATIVYPTISAGGIVLTFLLSMLIFKEKLSRNQYIGFVTGIVAVVVLNV